MKATRIKIANLYGVKEMELDGSPVEITGPKGAGKTSVLDAIRYALTNRSDRDCVVRQGAEKGEILIETDSGLSIDRKVKAGEKAGSVKATRNGLVQTRPAEFLNTIFTPLQLNPIAFTQMSRQEKNRVILSLVHFDWDLNWIRNQFGEIPEGIDYSKHILEVLDDIQSEKGVYFQSRQNINRDIRNKLAFIADIGKAVPPDYNYDKWNSYPVAEKYRQLAEIREKNSLIERARAFLSAEDGKIRGLQAERDISVSVVDKQIADERTRLTADIERMEAEIRAARDKMATLAERREDKVKAINADFEAKSAKLSGDMDTARKYAEQETVDTAELQNELNAADQMRKHLNEYSRMVQMQNEVDELNEESEELTRKIELARELPGTILEQADVPIEGLTVENGTPLIHGLPVSNLSDGELLELCVDISVSNPGQLQIILVDGAERLDEKSREVLYRKCKEKGLQMIATRVADTDELEVIQL